MQRDKRFTVHEKKPLKKEAIPQININIGPDLQALQRSSPAQRKSTSTKTVKYANSFSYSVDQFLTEADELFKEEASDDEKFKVDIGYAEAL